MPFVTRSDSARVSALYGHRRPLLREKVAGGMEVTSGLHHLPFWQFSVTCGDDQKMTGC
jgi:hypothetical protein